MLLAQLDEGVEAAVLFIDVDDDEAGRARGDANIRVGMLAPPRFDRVAIGARVFEAVLG